MTDKKLTDNDIAKALECCLDVSPSTCKNCPLFNVTNSTMVCSKIAIKFALDLINRLQAEIEMLKEKDETRHKVYMTKCEELEIAKAEARKEFAERLKEEKTGDQLRYGYQQHFIPIFEVDNLLKEMEGEK